MASCRLALASMVASAVGSNILVEDTFQTTAPGADVSLCNPCTQIGGQGINALVNYILNAGVIGGCGSLCAAVPSAPGKLACDLACGAVGMKAFIAAIEKADLDPIYLCELVRACPAGSDDAFLEFLDVVASPSTVAHGDDIRLVIDMNVVNETGVGEFMIDVEGPGTATPLSQSFILDKGIPSGQQMLAVKLTLQDGTDDQGFPATFEPGLYNFTFGVCQGECGSAHPHSKDFGRISGNFIIDGSLPPVTTPAPPSCEEAFDEDTCSKAQDFSGQPCAWCDDFMICQDSMIPCNGNLV